MSTATKIVVGTLALSVLVGLVIVANVAAAA
jgi:hypothetical protein